MVWKAGTISLTGKMNRNPGFTLLEVLVTVTIIAVTLVIVLGSFSLSLRTSDITKNYIKVNNFIYNTIEDLEFKARQFGLTDGEEEITNDLGEDFKVIESIKKENESNLSLVKLSINWPKGEKSFSTYVVNKEEIAPQP